MTPPRIALMGMILESNRFARPTTRADFERLTWATGEALLADARAETPTLALEFAAFVRAMDATGPWEPVPVLLAAAHPGGPVERAVFEDGVAAMRAGLAEPVDAVFLCHHGAMVAEHLDDPDGAIAEAVRDAVGPDVPIVQTLDLHANISDAMCEAVDLIVGYRTNPHVDFRERGEEAAFALRQILAGQARPAVAHVKLPIVPASVTLLTAEAPYGRLIDLGQRRQAELGGAILNVSVFGNFVFSDVPENGVSVVVTGRDGRAAAADLAQELAEQAWADREGFTRRLTPLPEAIERVLDPERAPIILSDAGDNPGGGGSGRTTELLAALIEAGAERTFVGSVFDPELAVEAHQLGQGARMTARFNRSTGTAPWERWDTPLSAEATVAALHSGQVTGRLGKTAGRRLDLGPSALLTIGSVQVVVISDRTQTADPIFFEMMGLDVADAHTVVVKSRGHFRAGFSTWFPPGRVFEVDTAGLTSPVLSRWPLAHIPRPAFPLDPETSWP